MNSNKKINNSIKYYVVNQTDWQKLKSQHRNIKCKKCYRKTAFFPVPWEFKSQ